MVGKFLIGLCIMLVLINGCCIQDKYNDAELEEYYNQIDTFNNLSCTELLEAFKVGVWYMEYDSKYGSRWCNECTPELFGGFKFLCGTYHEGDEIVHQLNLKHCYDNWP